MQWLAEAGHECHALSTARFESTAGATLDAHLTALGRHLSWQTPRTGSREAADRVDGVNVTIIETRHHDPSAPDMAEGQQYMHRFLALLRDVRPDAVLSYGGHPVLQAALSEARAAGITTIFTLRNLGYYGRRWYRHVDRVLTNSPWLTRHYAERTGLCSTPLVSPVLWSETLAPADDARGFLTFVNPSPHKGAALFARLAERLGEARPDIPILIVQSNTDTAALALAQGVNLTRFPQILVAPPIAMPRDLFALTRVLLVPSLFQEPFGRVAVEAMINGIPAIVSDRGALPETVRDGATVLPVPAWMEAAEARIPAAAEVQPWFEAVTRLWDDPVAYQQAASAARATADRLYSEAALRRQYEDWFTQPGPYPALFPG